MSSLTAKKHVTPSDSWEVNEKLPCSEHRISDGSGHQVWLVDDEKSVAGAGYFHDGVSVGDMANSGKGSKECGVLTALSQSTPRDLATSTQPDRSSGFAKEGNYEVDIKKKETVLNYTYEDGLHSEETNKGVNSFKGRDKSKDGEKERIEVDEPDDVDGGWGYMVVLGNFIIMIVGSVLVPGFGILFFDFLTEMKASSIVTTGIFNSESLTRSVSALLAGPLTEQLGWRAVATLGGLLCCLGMTASAYAPSASFLFFSYSVLTGFGYGLSSLVTFAIMPYYFKRLLGRANGISTAGMCVGAMIGPPIVTYLQEQFGFRGTTLIVAAFALHICLAAALFRPVHKLRKVKESTATPPGQSQLMGQIVCSLGRNCAFLKSPRFMIIAVGGSFTMGIYLNLLLLLPFVMQAKGHAKQTAAWCMTIFNLSNLVTRLVISSCSDMAWFSVLGCYFFFSTLISIGTITFGFVEEVTWMTVVLAVCDSAAGECSSLYPIIILRYVGLNLYVTVLSLSLFMNGIYMICSGPVIGVIIDLSGNYAVSLCPRRLGSPYPRPLPPHARCYDLRQTKGRAAAGQGSRSRRG